MSAETTEARERGTVVSSAGDAAAPVAHGVRRARVAVTRVDPWSVMKLAFLLSLALGVVLLVAVSVLWWVLNSGGVFSQLNDTIVKITGTETTFRLLDVVSFGRVMGFALVVSVIDVVLITALATLSAFLFNLATGISGGLDVTLTDASS